MSISDLPITKFEVSDLRALSNMFCFISRVLQYFNNFQENDLVDQSIDLRWKKITFDKLGVNLSIEVDPSLPECPGVLKNELGALKSIAGW